MSRTLRQVAQRAESRDAILAASLELFAHRGYRGASLAAIAKRCGIVQGAILHHFGSKEQLLLDLLEKYFAPDGSLLEPESLTDGPDVVFSRLASIVTTNEHRALLVRFYAVMVGESLTEGHPAGPFIRERFARLRSAVADAITDHEPTILRDEALTRAAQLIAASDGLQNQWLADPSFDMVTAFRQLAFAEQLLRA